MTDTNNTRETRDTHNMRYSKNQVMLTPEENQSLRHKKICIVGCGGLGGYLVEMAARLGIGNITVVDGDVFNSSNLNRQLYATEENLGLWKVNAAAQRVHDINSDVTVTPVPLFIDRNSADGILGGHDLVLDALDALAPRYVVQAAAKRLGIPMVHGAISGWCAQVTTIYPGDDTLNKIYPPNLKDLDNPMGNPSFTPALAASIQIGEMLKVLIKREETLQHKLLQIDMATLRFDIIDL